MKKLNFLQEIEKSQQHIIAQSKASDVYPNPNLPKYFITVPYPYTNGHLHLGHGFTFMKADFVARFYRMQGYNVLFPFAFHGSGTPIAACSLRVQEELARGPSKPREETPEKTLAEPTTNAPPKRKAKAKLAQKSSKSSTQSEILMSLGISEQDLPLFTNPSHYLEYFAPLMEKHLLRAGLSADFSRKFSTTTLNSYYDRFVRWQFSILKQKGLVEFEKRPIMFSPKDGQPCGDEERKVGEGVQVGQLHILPFVLALGSEKKTESPTSAEENRSFEVLLEKVALVQGERGDQTLHLLVGTTRAETFVGLTNLFVDPDSVYHIARVFLEEPSENKPQRPVLAVGNTHFFRNLFFQGRLETITQDSPGDRSKGEEWIPVGEQKWYAPLLSFKGKELLASGGRVSLGVLGYKIENLPLLPLKTSPNKGTGIVMSVPSDSAHDYASLLALSKKGEAKVGVDLDNLPQAVSLPVSMGELLKKFKSVEKTHEEHYKLSSGAKVAAGPFKGEGLETAREKTHAAIGFPFYEPESEVVSRTGNVCVAAKIDSWCLKYSDERWKEAVRAHVQTMHSFTVETREKLRSTVDWLGNWSCSRSFGLGNRLPFDDRYLIDSLSDSTIYMSFYTVSRAFQRINGAIFREWWRALFDFVLLGILPGPDERFDSLLSRPVSECLVKRAPESFMFDLEDPSQTGPEVKEDPVFDRFAQGHETFGGLLLDCRREFLHWYPMDCRVSGKELIFNHLTMMLFNHVAVFTPFTLADSPPESVNRPKTFEDLVQEVGRRTGVEHPQPAPKSREGISSLLPVSISCNGHLLLDNAKMSKSTGNFLTLEDACERFGADATRITLAEGGDFLNDSNFSSRMAESSVHKLVSLINSCREAFKGLGDGEDVGGTDLLAGEDSVFEKVVLDAQKGESEWVDFDLFFSQKDIASFNVFERVFFSAILNALEEATEYFLSFRIREALVSGFHELLKAKNTFESQVALCGKGGASSRFRGRLVKLSYLVLVRVSAPIVPHVADYIHQEIMGFRGRLSLFGSDAEGVSTWPKVSRKASPLDLGVSLFLESAFSNIRKAITLYSQTFQEALREAVGSQPAENVSKIKALVCTHPLLLPLLEGVEGLGETLPIKKGKFKIVVAKGLKRWESELLKRLREFSIEALSEMRRNKQVLAEFVSKDPGVRGLASRYLENIPSLESLNITSQASSAQKKAQKKPHKKGKEKAKSATFVLMDFLGGVLERFGHLVDKQGAFCVGGKEYLGAMKKLETVKEDFFDREETGLNEKELLEGVWELVENIVSEKQREEVAMLRGVFGESEDEGIKALMSEIEKAHALVVGECKTARGVVEIVEVNNSEEGDFFNQMKEESIEVEVGVKEFKKGRVAVIYSKVN